jgi:hypothetical protein
MKNILSIILLAFVLILSCTSVKSQSNIKSVYFSQHSKAESSFIELKAGDKKMLINTIIANGENVKSLSIKMANGSVFKLAPAQNGQTLNYFGSSMVIVLMPNESATIEFDVLNKSQGKRQIYVAGQLIDDSK